MTRPRSLRWRFLVGTTLWTVGLLAIAHFTSITLMHHYPSLTHFDHRALVALALAFMAVGLGLVRSGLSPIRQLRARLSAVHQGRDTRVHGQYPTEVQPLVDDLNALLAHRERIVSRAIAKAGDLAHRLKTPLAVLSQEAERAHAQGHRHLADAISQEIARMQRQVDYHLAHARAAASGAAPGARCSVIESVAGLSRTLLRLHDARGVAIDVKVSPDHAVRAQREDVDEILGNLLDNAFKYASARVTVESAECRGRVVITIDDDGPGLEPSMRDAVLQRGVRADEAAPGSGLGLAIVRDLVEVYGGTMSLGPSPAGGLRARLELPAC
jgi:signal transduction histidine kinase